MTDANGSATQVDPANAGTPDPANGGTPQGSNGAASDPFAGLEKGTREWIGTKGYKTVNDLAVAHHNAESLIGRSVQIPGDDAKPEDWDKVYDRLGRPKEAKEYEFKLPDNVPENFAYDEGFRDEFREAARAAGLSKKQAAALHDFYVTKSVAFATQGNENLKSRVTAASEAMEKAWGESGGDRFKQGSDNVIKAMKGLGIEEELQAIGALGPNRLVLSPKIAFALEKVGQSMFSEDQLADGQGVSTSSNPFKDGPNKGNLTDQMRVIRQDRDHAIRLIRQAGHKPEDFGLQAS